MGGSNIKIESSYQFQLKNYFTKTIDDKMITNDVSEHVQLQEASKEKLAVFGGELLKRKSSTCLLPTIIENNKNKQYVNVTSDTSRAIKKVPSRLYNSAPPDEKQEMTLQPLVNQRRFSRRLSVTGANSRKSVDVRGSSLRLSRYDEVSPLAALSTGNPSFFSQFAPESLNEDGPRNSRRMSGYKMTYKPIIEPLNEATEGDDNASPIQIISDKDNDQSSKRLAKELRRLTNKIVERTTSKEEVKIRRTFRIFITVWLLGTATALYGIIKYVWRKNEINDIESNIIIICQFVFALIAIIIPRRILTKAFREKVEKSQRFQTLRNVFLEKEVDEFNKGLQSQGF